MSHVCARCGVDLSHLRAPPDPIYGLPIVVCPGCGDASVRRALLKKWRRRSGAAVAPAIGAAAWRALAFVTSVLTGLVIASVASDIAGSFDPEPPVKGFARVEPSVWELVGGIGVMFWLAALSTLVTALLIVVSIGHLGRVRRLVAWLAALGLVWWIIPHVGRGAQIWFDVSPEFTLNQSSTKAHPPFRWEWGSGMPLVGMVAALAAVAAWTPIVDRFGRFTRRQIWLSHMTRARVRRDRRRR